MVFSKNFLKNVLITLTVSYSAHEDRPLILPWDSIYFDIWGLLFSF